MEVTTHHWLVGSRVVYGAEGQLSVLLLQALLQLFAASSARVFPEGQLRELLRVRGWWSLPSRADIWYTWRPPEIAALREFDSVCPIPELLYLADPERMMIARIMELIMEEGSGS